MNTISNNPITEVAPIELSNKEHAKSLKETNTQDNAKSANENAITAEQVGKTDHKQEANISHKQMELVAQQLQNFVGEMNKGLEFSVDKDSGRDVIKVIDKNSGDLIKQYPTEEVLDLVSKLSNAAGSLINEKV